MPTVIVPSYAKLNLFLRIVGLRPDGYHEIESVFERISLHDTIALYSTKESAIRIRCRAPGIPRDERNLCYKAAQALQERFKISSGCEIRLNKCIPAGSGMGGGSSNAAAVLKGLCRLWRVRLSLRSLVQVAAAIGSDVPFFVHDASFARVAGRGERVAPITGSLPTLFHVVVVPPVHVSTKEIYAKWDAAFMRQPRLTIHKEDVTILLSALKKRDSRALCDALTNDLERVAIHAYPAIDRVRRQLVRQAGVEGVRMTGSGAAVFAIFTSEYAARACCRRLSGSSQRVFYARTQ